MKEGVVYVDGVKILIADCMCVPIPILKVGTEEAPDNLGKTNLRVGGSFAGSISIRNIKQNRLAFLSLLYGFRVTNNWLKMHGGIMVRSGGKKRGRR